MIPHAVEYATIAWTHFGRHKDSVPTQQGRTHTLYNLESGGCCARVDIRRCKSKWQRSAREALRVVKYLYRRRVVPHRTRCMDSNFDTVHC